MFSLLHVLTINLINKIPRNWSQWLLLDAKMSNFSSTSWREQVTFDEMIMSALYQTNTLKWIFSVSSLKQFLLDNAACLEEKQQIPTS